MGTVVNEKVGELEDDVKEGFFMRVRKDLTGAVQ